MEIDGIINKISFSALKGKIDDRILEALNSNGFEKPTPIQAQSLPHLLQGKDLIGGAKTGSGKTLAFLIPVIDQLVQLGFTKNHGTGCIILSPTRELALQTYEVLKKMLLKIKLTHALLVGGEKKVKETKLLSKGVNIVVSTPGRLLDHLQGTKEFKFDCLKCLIVDEADKLLEAGFQKHVTGIIKCLPKSRQTVLFSATIDGRVQNLARLALRTDPVTVTVADDTKAASRLQQGYYLCPTERRLCWLFKLLRRCRRQKVMVFFSSCKSVDFHYEFFKHHCQASVLSIHGQQTQPRRKEAYKSFVEAQSGALLCTDVAARGLDIPAVDWIVQYDPPTDVKEYIHRVGRTARGLHNTGSAVLLLRPEEEDFIAFLRKKNVHLDRYSFEDLAEDVQDMLQELVSSNGVVRTLARKAFLSFLRCYKTHPLKNIFDISTLDLSLAAKAFGFLETPHVDFLTLDKKKS